MKILTLLFALVLLCNISFGQVQNPQLKRYTDRIKLYGLDNPNSSAGYKPGFPKKQMAKSNPESGIKAEKRNRVSVEMPVVKPKKNTDYSLLVSPTDTSRHYQLIIKNLN